MTLQEFARQWDLESLPACEEGMALLQRFVQRYPEIYKSVRPSDFAELDNPAFASISEWEAFAAHRAGCGSCNEE